MIFDPEITEKQFAVALAICLLGAAAVATVVGIPLSMALVGAGL